MTIENPYALFSLFVRILALAIILVFLVPKQAREVARPKNGFTVLRWYILALLVFAAFTMVPTAPRLVQLIQQPSAGVTANIASLSSSFGLLAFVTALVLIFTYRERK